MKRIWLFVIASSAAGMHSAQAGALYGTLTLGNSPAAGYALHLECPGIPTTTVATDNRGRFSLLARAVGSCNMWVQHGGAAGRKFVVFVSDNPMRIDLSIDSALNKR